ncbi:hypothetical protein QTV44_002499 [Vibrio vulnificus]|nr:hypothetical protein [Vibrio vulnificus]
MLSLHHPQMRRNPTAQFSLDPTRGLSVKLNGHFYHCSLGDGDFGDSEWLDEMDCMMLGERIRFSRKPKIHRNQSQRYRAVRLDKMLFSFGFPVRHLSASCIHIHSKRGLIVLNPQNEVWQLDLCRQESGLGSLFVFLASMVDLDVIRLSYY